MARRRQNRILTAANKNAAHRSVRPNWFIALPCPAGHWFDALPTCYPVPRRVRLFAATDLHMTVAFLGGVAESAARAAFALARQWPSGPLNITLGDVVPMGPTSRFSALSARVVHGDIELTRGIEACRDMMRQAAGLQPERRTAIPHMTIARPQRRASADEREAALNWARSLDLANVAVRLDDIALYTWAETRETQLFRIVERQSLQR